MASEPSPGRLPSRPKYAEGAQTGVTVTPQLRKPPRVDNGSKSTIGWVWAILAGSTQRLISVWQPTASQTGPDGHVDRFVSFGMPRIKVP